MNELYIISFISLGSLTGLFCYFYIGLIKCWSLRSLNYLCDRYLDMKYHGYQSQDVLKKYELIKIVVITNNQSYQLSTYDSLDMRQHKIQLNCDQLNCESTDSTMILIHYQYGSDQYIIPINYLSHRIINLPIYDPLDLDSCYCHDYEKIEIKSIHASSIKSDVTMLVKKYAGPKGNFYCDTKYQLTPMMIYDDCGCPLLTQENDLLQLTTILGQPLTFERNQPINIDTI